MRFRLNYVSFSSSGGCEVFLIYSVTLSGTDEGFELQKEKHTQLQLSSGDSESRSSCCWACHHLHLICGLCEWSHLFQQSSEDVTEGNLIWMHEGGVSRAHTHLNTFSWHSTHSRALFQPCLVRPHCEIPTGQRWVCMCVCGGGSEGKCPADLI